MNESKTKAKRNRRKLAVAHRHRGILWPAGAEIDLLPHQEERLDRQAKLAPKGGAAPSI